MLSYQQTVGAPPGPGPGSRRSNNVLKKLSLVGLYFGCEDGICSIYTVHHCSLQKHVHRVDTKFQTNFLLVRTGNATVGESCRTRYLKKIVTILK